MRDYASFSSHLPSTTIPDYLDAVLDRWSKAAVIGAVLGGWIAILVLLLTGQLAAPA